MDQSSARTDNVVMVEPMSTIAMTFPASPSSSDGRMRSTARFIACASMSTTAALSPPSCRAPSRISTFSRFRTDDLLALANAAQTVTLAEGATLCGEGSPPALVIVVAGEVVVDRRDGTQVTAHSGDAIGLHESLAGRTVRAARVVRRGTALRLGRDDLYDLLADRPQLLQQLFTALFGVRDSVAA